MHAYVILYVWVAAFTLIIYFQWSDKLSDNLVMCLQWSDKMSDDLVMCLPFGVIFTLVLILSEVLCPKKMFYLDFDGSQT